MSEKARRQPRARAAIVAAIFFMTFLVFWGKSFWKGNGVGYMSYQYLADGTARRMTRDVEIICGSIIIGSEHRTLSRHGEVEVSKQLQRGFYVYSPQPQDAYVNWMPRQSSWNKLGFFIMSDSGVSDAILRRVILPGWFVLLLSGAVTAYLLHRARRNWVAVTRQMRGECMHCGYDLRASPQCCPECGATSGVPTR